MIRQTININNFEYVVDLYDVTQNEYYPSVSKEYVILRNISFIENISYDTDIFFIEKNIFNEIKNNNSLITDKVVFPVYNNYFGSFSHSVSDFSNTISKNNFKLDTEGGCAFSLLKRNNDTGKYTSENVFIKCDKIKIYHPQNKTDLDYIIYIDNIINGIHFHYFCNLNSNCEINSETEFKLNNKSYSEYFEVYLPNIYELFKERKIEKDENGKIISDDNIYFNDFYNITKFVNFSESEFYKYKHDLEESSSWLTLNNNTTLFNEVEKMSYLPLYMLLHPFISNLQRDEKDDEYFEKIYFKLSHQDTNNYNSLPLNITLYPYEQNKNENYYLTHSKYVANSDVFVKDFKFLLCSHLGFDDNQLSIISHFNFYDKKTESNPDGLEIEEAYAKYNGLTLLEDENNKKYYKEYAGWIRTYEEWVKKQPEDADTSFEHYRYLQNDEYSPDLYINCCGFKIEVATDFSFKHIIGEEYIEEPENNVSHSIIKDNFSFSLLHLFNNWKEIPKTIIARVKFIDKYLGIEFTSNTVIINKEWIKYSINDIDLPRIYSNFIEKQNNDIMGWNILDANDTNLKFNFIDTFNCIVNKESESDNISKFSNNGLKIVYKPIFYKAQDLQLISLRDGFKQKIGINLADYMTKVAVFKLVIGGIEYSEFGRNDIYTIFEVDANLIDGTSGIYNIVDNKDNYLSSGRWVKN